MDLSLDRRQMLKAGAGLAAGVAAASTVGSMLGAGVADAAPAKPKPPKPKLVGSIAIEKLWGSKKVKKVKVLNTKGVYEGTDKTTLNTGGICHWIGTTAPLGLGNCVLFGHRTAAGGPLRNTHKLKPGDQIVLKIGSNQKTYSVVEPPSVIGKREFSKAINWGDQSQANLTLVACTKPNPPYLPTSTDFRLLIRCTAI